MGNLRLEVHQVAANPKNDGIDVRSTHSEGIDNKPILRLLAIFSYETVKLPTLLICGYCAIMLYGKDKACLILEVSYWK